MGAWIEIVFASAGYPSSPSHPTWVRGLKCNGTSIALGLGQVAPYMGAWIEIFNSLNNTIHLTVAPYMGAWIEINTFASSASNSLVAPYMGAWIEIYVVEITESGRIVAPYMGAWIEI